MSMRQSFADTMNGPSAAGVRARSFVITRASADCASFAAARFGGRAVAFGTYPLQQHARRFVVRVLRHKLTAESFGEDRLIEPIEERVRRLRLGNEPVNCCEGVLDAPDYFALLFELAPWENGCT